MKKQPTWVLAIVLIGCAGPQIAPDIPEIPSSNFLVETIADGLSAPWSVVEMPDGSFLVTERGGALKHVATDGVVKNISGLPEDIYVNQQGGLHDVVLSPDFKASNTVFLSYASGTKKANATAVFKAELSGQTLENGKVIFTASPFKDTASHFGGRMDFLADGNLLLTLGDGFAYREAAQDKSSNLGKVMHIAADGNASRMYSYGHRNVQGLHIDDETGDVWTHEHGPKGGDELNLTLEGANYGWPLATTGVDYNGAKITPFKSIENTEPFVHDWVPSIAPSGLTIYRGDMFPQWNGDALVGGLVSKDVRRVDLENGKSVKEESLFGDLKYRVRDVRTASDGAILLVVDDPDDGKVVRLSAKN